MNKIRDFWNLVGPIFTILLIITAIWYASAVWLNSAWAYDKAKRANVTISFSEMVTDTMMQEKPLLPSPHQVIKEIYKTTVLKKVTSKRSLIWHGWITLSATLLGFAFGTALGILLAVGIVFSKSMDMSVMPWVITSQTIPILAIAPMIIVVLNAIGVSGLLPKAIISMYLSFFPVVVGMVKGLRSPDQMQLDQMRTWSAPKTTSFWKLDRRAQSLGEPMRENQSSKPPCVPAQEYEQFHLQAASDSVDPKAHETFHDPLPLQSCRHLSR